MKTWLDSEEINDLDHPVVAIVRFNADRYPKEPMEMLLPQRPSVFFQVTISKENVSPSGRFIRFGQTTGDELHGWMRRDLIWVEELLGELESDGKTVKVIKMQKAA